MAGDRKPRERSLETIDAVGDTASVEYKSRPTADEHAQPAAIGSEPAHDPETVVRTDGRAQPSHDLGGRTGPGEHRFATTQNGTAAFVRRPCTLIKHRVAVAAREAQGSLHRRATI